MTPNLSTVDRIVRALLGIALVVASVSLPLTLVVRATVFGGVGAHLLLTALAGSCLGYRLLGRSTCPTRVVR